MRQKTTITVPDELDYSLGAADLLTSNSEAAKAFIVSEGSRLCVAALGAKAGAVVLTGSMSRGEATLKRDGVGWRALGDATFLVIFDVPVRLKPSEL